MGHATIVNEDMEVVRKIAEEVVLEDLIWQLL
jgi:hypothetical protein